MISPRTSVRLPLSASKRASSMSLLPQMSPQEDLIFQMLTWSFRWSPLKILKLTFIVPAVPLALETQALASPSSTRRTRLSFRTLRIKLESSLRSLVPLSRRM